MSIFVSDEMKEEDVCPPLECSANVLERKLEELPTSVEQIKLERGISSLKSCPYKATVLTKLRVPASQELHNIFPDIFPENAFFP